MTKVLESLLGYWYEIMAKISIQQSRHHQQCLNHFPGAQANIYSLFGCGADGCDGKYRQDGLAAGTGRLL